MKQKYSKQQSLNAAKVVAASELVAAIELASHSESPEVRAFGCILATRLPVLFEPDTMPYCYSLDELKPYIDLGREAWEQRERLLIG